MSFLEDYSFKYSWRGYQGKVLRELETHLMDNKINIVAAPGAGKTVLGLEIVRRLNKNVLILSPSITIKNQWVDRFLELFVQDNPPPAFVSTDIYQLNRFNVATYQALHYAYKRKRLTEESVHEEENQKKVRSTSFEYDLIGQLKANHIEVIVLDEAHHLRAAWWNSLTGVLKSLENIKTVALTATPPYDAEKGEWDKYLEICGSIDNEITVPELVATGDLCAHQDFVIFNKLSSEEEQQVTRIKRDFDGFVANLKTNQDLIAAVTQMPELQDYGAHEEKLLDNPQVYSSLLVFLKEVGGSVNDDLVQALGGGAPVPRLNAEWLEIMLQGVLFQGILYDEKDSAVANKKIVKDIYEQLHRIGGVINGKVSVQANNEIKGLLAGSIGKMGSIAEIVLNEHGALEQELSMVILADYVRREALDDDTYQKIGVVPIFKRIVRDIGVTPNADNVVAGKIATIAVLSGKLKIIPKTLVVLVQEKVPCQCQDTGLEGYVEIKTSDKYENQLVSLITNLMNEKKINIIIGTVALLGEGWDCPAVNSLVLASYVGSFMLSNQMRGRAIRSNQTKDKVSNIWHLVSLTKEEYDTQRALINNMDLSDYLLLERRFKCFLGIAYHSHVIQNSIGRLDVLKDRNLQLEFAEINKEMYRISRTRQHTKKRWGEILTMYGGEDIQIVHTLKSDFQKEKRFKPLAAATIKKEALLAVPPLAGLLMMGVALTNLPKLFLLLILGGLLSAVTTGRLCQGLLRVCRRFDRAKNMKVLGQIVLSNLQKLALVKSKSAVIHVETTRIAGTKMFETELHHSTTYENNLFIQSMREIYQRVDNPRYLIAFIGKHGKRDEYFNVPSVFSDHKAKAEQFHKMWQVHMGQCQLVYTRTTEGRKTLLKARKGSFDYSERVSEQQRGVRKTRWR